MSWLTGMPSMHAPRPGGLHASSEQRPPAAVRTLIQAACTLPLTAPAGWCRDSQPYPRGQEGELVGPHEGIPQVLVDSLLRNPERATDPDRLNLTRVNETVDGHLGHPHDRGDLAHGQEPDITKGSYFCCDAEPSSGEAACAEPDSAHQSRPSPA